jgi:putative hydrolase of the HAD superfamily
VTNKYKTIGFDADDTLWVNEPYFQDTEKKFAELMSEYGNAEFIRDELYKTEMANLADYGYGAKGFSLSLIETALRLSKGKNPEHYIREIIGYVKDLVNKPVILLEGVGEILAKLRSCGYRLIVATKGDLRDQERKLEISGLGPFFHHIEVMTDKKTENYRKLLSHLDIRPEEFLMVGNSLRSDILPVLEMGGHAVLVPFHTSWIHEAAEKPVGNGLFHELESLQQLEKILCI